ncbi:MAG: SsrA-binding protein SmpB [Myxococcota bacterium]|jgi:SsrA-binding protein|nr:SsrA-binding protein SmpB [Myxococcota bacterium]
MAGSTRRDGTKVLVRNRKAFFEYEILERYEAGISLLGSEVKSIRASRISLSESFARFDEKGELFLQNCHIAEYPWANRNNHEPLRARKLLLTRRELGKLSQEVSQAGCTLVPLSVYLKQGKVKVELGVAKGKKLYDKRETVKKRTAQRELDRDLS